MCTVQQLYNRIMFRCCLNESVSIEKKKDYEGTLDTF